MKQIIPVLVLSFLWLHPAAAAAQDADFESVVIHKSVREFPDRYDLNTPLASFLTFKYLQAEGKEGSYRAVNSHRIRGFLPPAGSPVVDVKPASKNAFLNTAIEEIWTYGDSLAGVLTPAPDGSFWIITYLSREDGRWLNAGEDMGMDLNGARQVFRGKAPVFSRIQARIRLLSAAPRDVSAFAEYLKERGRDPRTYILDALAAHPIVIYGEIHRRRASWDLMRSVIADPAFVRRAGTILMELSSDRQSDLDRFLAADNPDGGIILGIFRDVQVNGWYDRGMYEFLLDVWALNRKTPPKDRIRVVAVDVPRPFGSFRTAAEMDDHFRRVGDRNEHMASVATAAFRGRADARNVLFIVGCAHVYRSPVFGLPSGESRSEAGPTAGARLAGMFPGGVFTIFSHTPIISNDGTVHGRIRNGIFDGAFSRLGNRPVAFDLKDSPFGREPFDGIHEIAYETKTGSYGDNYDGYLFLGPLEEEPGEYLLADVIDDAYFAELKRRAAMAETSLEKWFGLKEATKEAIVADIKQETANPKRWKFMD